MMVAIKALASELRITVIDSTQSGTVHNVEETVREASDTYRIFKREIENAEK